MNFIIYYFLGNIFEPCLLSGGGLTIEELGIFNALVCTPGLLIGCGLTVEGGTFDALLCPTG
jgi:hypothetical protein